jgi:branched-chain amino acid transport system permease protein
MHTHEPAGMKTIVQLLLLVLLAGCGDVDLHQAELCGEVARILFADGQIGRMTSERDPAVPHGVVTSVAMRDSGAAHRVTCTFESSGLKSADQLALAMVSSDVEGLLSAARLADLRQALEQKGIYWMVSWIPLLGPPHAASEPAALDVAALYFLQLLINALTYGSLIALVALGYTLIGGITGVINLAFGDIYMIGAFIAVGFILLLMGLGAGSFLLSVIAALPLTLLVTAGYSALSDRAVFRPLRYASPQMPLIASIGVSMMLQGYVFTTGGARDLWVTAPLPGGFVLAATDGFSLYVNWWQTVIVVATVLLTTLLWLVLTRTSFGRAHRACAQDRRMASLLGIDVDRVIGMTFGFAGMFAAAGGLMAATYYGSISVVMGVAMGLKALTAAVVGGIGNAKGAIIGGFVVALSESFAAGYFFAAYKEVVVFAILILLLIFRPQGLFGEA